MQDARVQIGYRSYRPTIATSTSIAPAQSQKTATAVDRPVHYDWAALLEPREVKLDLVGVRARDAEARSSTPADEPATAELKTMARQLRAAVLLLPLARQISELGSPVVGGLADNGPLSQIEARLRGLLFQSAPAPDGVALVQEGAAQLFTEIALARVGKSLAALELRAALSDADALQIQSLRSELESIDRALARLPRQDMPALAKLHKAIEEARAQLGAVARRPWADRAPPRGTLPPARANGADAWQEEVAANQAKLDAWRGILADALALRSQPGGDPELIHEVAVRLLGEGLRIVDGEVKQLTEHAQRSEGPKSNAYRTLALDWAELLLRATTSRAALESKRGDNLAALAILHDVLAKAGAPSEVLAAAKARFEAILPLVLGEARELIARDRAGPSSDLGLAADRFLRAFTPLPDRTEQLSALVHSLRGVYTRGHLQSYRDAVDQAKQRLAILRVARIGAAADAAASTLDLIRSKVSRGDNPNLLPEQLGDRPGLIAELEELARAIKLELSQMHLAELQDQLASGRVLLADLTLVKDAELPDALSARAGGWLRFTRELLRPPSIVDHDERTLAGRPALASALDDLEHKIAELF